MIVYKAIDHIQICIPHGEIDKARVFYCDILGFTEIEKPDVFSGDQYLWVAYNNIQLHIGTEDPSPLSQRHPAFEVEDLQSVRQYLESKDISIKDSRPIPERERFSIRDYWGNKIEFLEKY